MFKVSVMYPNQEGARFDIDYYRYEKGIAASAGALRSDIANFTDVTPIRQVSEIIAAS